MSHPRIEEVEDSDDAYSDPSEGDIDDFDEGDILRAVQPKTSQVSQTSQTSQPPRLQQQQPQLRDSGPPPSFGSFPALYPVYFDRSRSRAEGRRVSRALAVDNPLARDIVSACAGLGLRTVFEPTKTHPKDWANPGRVKVDLKGVGPQPNAPAHADTPTNKHHLYILVARYLAANPTTENSAGLRETMRGAPPPPPIGEPYPKPAVPRGWKMPALVPYLSAAMTGGGVSDNLFQDVMKEMGSGGAGGGGLPGMGGAGGMPGLQDMQRAMQAMSGGPAAGGAGQEAGGGSKKSKKGKGRA